MSRLPTVSRDALAPEDQAVCDRIAAVRTSVRGPFGALIHVPKLADRVAACARPRARDPGDCTRDGRTLSMGSA